MHRPGIIRVEGDRVILNGTSLEEIEKYHRKTLLLVVNKVNLLFAEQERERNARTYHEEEQRRRHREEVTEIAKRLGFDSSVFEDN